MSAKNGVRNQSHSVVEFSKRMDSRQADALIHQVDMQFEKISAPEPLPKSVQPPPPPPNPKYLQVEATAIPATPEMVSPESGSPTQIANTSALYDVQTNGPLTYFNYYFEELGTVKPDAEFQSAGRPKLTMGLVGAGAIAATVASGLVIGDVWQKSQAPEDAQPKDASVRQDAMQNAAKNLPRPATSSPERQDLERSPKPRSTPMKRSNSTPRKTSSLQPEQLLQPPVLNTPPIAAPETLSLASPPVRSSIPLPRVPAKPPATWTDANIPRMSVQAAAARQAALASVAQPETLPSGNPVAATSSTPLPSDAAPAPSVSAPSASINATNATTPFPGTPPTSSDNAQGLTGSEPDAATIANPPAMNAPATVTNSPSNSPTPEKTNGLQRLFPQSSLPQSSLPQSSSNASTGDRQSPTPASRNEAPSAVPEPSARSANTPGIQDYVNLPKNLPPTRSVALMPLSQQAAVEASSTPQIGEFKVRQVNPQDYQKEWANSNQGTEDPAIATAFPAYGFIDYQRQVIVVLQDNSSTTPMQSQRLTPASS